ncbi:MAG: RND family transporter [Gemmatimonadota bacterium]
MLRIPHKCALLFRFHRPMLLAGLVATAIGIYLSSRLSLQSDLAELLPSDSKSVRALERMKQEVGGIGQLRIVLESDDFPAMRRFAEDLDPQLVASPYVSYVDYRNDVAFYEKNALLLLEPARLDSLREAIQSTIDREKQRLNPLLVDDLFGDSSADEAAPDELAKWETEYRDQEPKPYYTNADSTVLVMKVFASRTSSNLNFDRKMAAAVKRIVGSANAARYDPDMKIYYGGSIQNRIDEFATVKHDIVGTALYGVLGVFLLIVLYFRSVLGAVLVAASLLASLSWTFGVTYLVIGQLNTITGFLFVILFGLGIDYGIHAWARYMESRRIGLSVQESIDKMVCGTGTALGTTAVTTSAAFFSLLLMDFKGFSDLGFIAGIGMLFAFVAMVFMLPALTIFAERLGLVHVRPPPKPLEEGRRIFRSAKGVLGVTAVLVVLSGFAFSRVGFEFDFTNLRAMTPERELVGEKTRGVFSRSESPAVVVGESRQDVEEIVEAVKEKMRSDTLSPTISGVRSVFSLVPADQPERLRKIAEIRTLIEDEAEGVVSGEEKRRLDELDGYLQVREPFTWADFPESDKRQFLNRWDEVGNFVFIYPSVALRDGRNAMEFRDDVGTIVTKSGKVFHAASSNIIAAEMLSLITKEGWMSGALAFTVVFLLVLADFRTFRAAVLVLTPLAVGVLWMGGLMYVFGMKVNFFNIVVLPSIIGIGVDSGVHLYHRYLEEGRGSLKFVLRRTGLTIAMTTLTTIVGYSGLILARHPGLRSMGDLAVIGLSTTFLAAVVVLPALLQVVEERRAREHSGPSELVAARRAVNS